MHLVMGLVHMWRAFTMRTPQTMETSALDGPEAEYGRRLAIQAEQFQKIRRRHQHLWICLIASAIATAGGVVAGFWLPVQWRWLFVPVVPLVWSLRSLILTTRRCKELWALIRFYEGGLARLRSCWQGQGVTDEEHRPEKHLYAADLDVFGVGSLFEMLCTARTGIGRATLANWLLHPASAAEIHARHEAVMELRDNLDLQEQWILAGETDPSRVTSSALEKWVGEPAMKFHTAVRVLAPILPLLILTIIVLRGFVWVGAHWLPMFGVVVALELVVAGVSRRQSRSIAENVILPAFELSLLAPLLDRIQREHFRSPLLNQLQLQLSPHVDAWRGEIIRLRLWSWLLNLRRSEYFAAVTSLLLWQTNVTIRVENWRIRNSRRVVDWLEVVGRFETLLCLSRYSFENPKHTFPHITSGGRAFFRAEGLGHPLLPASEFVPCDVSFDSSRVPLMILSGSNMSGKSTLLRSVGVNAVLAMAGAPVRASRLEMSGLRIGCSIGVHDSLLDGKSRFFAEVERLKEILASARANVAIVLLDEVLGGTNSQDRFFGTRAVLDQLLRSGALVVATTHDLALTELVYEFPARAANAHFEENWENGTMRFDYQLRPGVVSRTNGESVITALGLLS